MAVKSRAKQAKGRSWANTNAERAEQNKGKKVEKEISEEEHKEKLDLLKEIGLIKEEN